MFESGNIPNLILFVALFAIIIYYGNQDDDIW
jgi:hypothetical protein